jgi:ribosomal silencing factor RsfS
MKIIDLTKEDISQRSDISDAIKVSIDCIQKEPLEKTIFAELENYITPFVFIAITNSPRHIDAICTNVIKNLKERQLFQNQIRIDGSGERGWCIIDLSTCFINIITTEKFEYYSLEKILKGDFS